MVDVGILQFCVHEVAFPADKRRVTLAAAKSGCPGDVVIALLDLPEGSYLSEDDLLCRLGDPAYCSPQGYRPRPASAGL
jgi:hypothetical protein